MKNVFLLILLFFLRCYNLQAQVSSGIDAQDNINQMGGFGNIVRVMKPIKEATKGSPLLFDVSSQAITYKDGFRLKTERFNYHLSEKKFLIETRTGLNFLEEFTLDSLIFLDDEITFIRGDLIIPEFGNLPIEKLVIDGEFSVFIEHSVQFIPASVEGAYAGGNKYDEYIKKMNFYILDNGKLKSVKFNKKLLIEICSDYSSLEK